MFYQVSISKAGAQCTPTRIGGRGISIPLTNSSFDPTVQCVKSGLMVSLIH